MTNRVSDRSLPALCGIRGSLLGPVLRFDDFSVSLPQHTHTTFALVLAVLDCASELLARAKIIDYPETNTVFLNPLGYPD